jgi:hypothetical protein
MLGSQKQALQLRYLQTLTEVATEGTNTIVFPLPMDLFQPFMDIAEAVKTKVAAPAPEAREPD